MSSPDIRLVPALPEHVDAWMAMREHFLIKGQRKDQQVWSLLRSEWEGRRARP